MKLDRAFWMLYLLVIIGFLTECLLVLFSGRSNLNIVNAYTLLEFVLITLMFYKTFIRRTLKVVSLSLVSIFIAFDIISHIYYGWNHILPGTTIFESFGLTVLAIFSLEESYRLTDSIKELINKPEFWFSAGILIYFGGGFFIHSYSSEYLKWNSDFKFDLWNLHGIINIIFNLSLAAAIWKTLKVDEQ